jgi:hypothetical protein
MDVIVRHLVEYPRGFAAVYLTQPSIMAKGELPYSVPGQVADAGNGGLAVAAEQAGDGLEIAARERQLAGAVNLGMARQDLFDQRRTGAREAHDEDGPPGVETGA